MEVGKHSFAGVLQREEYDVFFTGCNINVPV
jgi:hypothetical protein